MWRSPEFSSSSAPTNAILIFASALDEANRNDNSSRKLRLQTVRASALMQVKLWIKNGERVLRNPDR